MTTFKYFKRRFLTRARLIICVIFLLIFLFNFWLIYGGKKSHDSYSHAVYRPIDVRRGKHAPQIALLVIVYDNKKPQEYQLAQNTLKCYAKLHNYTLINLNLANEVEYLEDCPGKDFMFRRHCVVVNLMLAHPEIEWWLFLDADMAIVNPNHLIEKYIDHSSDLTFYDRLFNYEITAGSYLAKNTEFSRNFLLKWSQYERRIDTMTFQVNASDNGAIHEILLDEFCYDCSVAERKRCSHIWFSATNFKELFLYESCARIVLGARNRFENKFGIVRQLSNTTDYWSRDGWQTDNKFCSEDFILHGWKESLRYIHGKKLYFAFKSPIANETDFDLKRCNDPKLAYLNWPYKDTFIRPTNEIRQLLEQQHHKAFADHFKRASEMLEKYPIV